MNKIYIDCGTHNGNSINEFLASSSIFIKRKDAHEYKIFAFEPNASFYNLKENFKNVEVIEKAVWINDGEIAFKNDPASLSSCVSKFAMQCYDQKFASNVVFPCIDLAKFILSLDSSYVVLKMDIESSEYEVLPHLIKTGAIDKIHELYVEYHHFYDENNTKIRKNIENKMNNILYFNNWP